MPENRNADIKDIEDIDFPEVDSVPSENIGVPKIDSMPAEDITLPEVDSASIEDIGLPEIDEVSSVDDMEIDTMQEPARDEISMSRPDTDNGLLVELKEQTDILREIADREGLS